MQVYILVCPPLSTFPVKPHLVDFNITKGIIKNTMKSSKSLDFNSDQSIFLKIYNYQYVNNINTYKTKELTPWNKFRERLNFKLQHFVKN